MAAQPHAGSHMVAGRAHHAENPALLQDPFSSIAKEMHIALLCRVPIRSLLSCQQLSPDAGDVLEDS